MSDNITGNEPGQTLPSAVPAAPRVRGLVPRAPLKLRTIFGATFRLFAQNPRPNLGASVAVGIVASALGYLITALAGPAGNPFVSVLSTLALLLLTGFIGLSVATAIAGEKLTFVSLLSRLKPRLPTLIVWAVIATAVAALAYGPTLYLRVGDPSSPPNPLILGVVAISSVLSLLLVFYTVRLVYVPVIVAVEGGTVLEAVRRSFRLSRGYFWWTFGVLGLTVIGLGIPAGIIVALERNLGAAPLVIGVVSCVLNVIFGAVIAAVTSLMYFNLRFRKDGPGTTI